MALVYANASADFINGRIPGGRITEATSTRVVISDGYDATVYAGYGFSYSSSHMTGGTVNEFGLYRGNTLALDISDFNAYAPTVEDYVFDDDLEGLLSYVLAFDDDIYGSNQRDVLAGFAGDDFFDAGEGDDDIYGGSGIDLAFFAGRASDFEIRQVGSHAYQVIDLYLADGNEGNDLLFDVELVQFSDGRTYNIGDLVGPATPWYDQPSNIEVVAATYQFFTDRVPTAAGFEYLISSPANPNDLNDAYYAQFNVENRYINFASNLGTVGEGAAFFDAAFGGLSYEATIRAAYFEVMGEQLVGAAYSFFLQAQGYYQAVASARVVRPGVDLFEATKIVAIGSILNEGIKSGDGPYAFAIDDLVSDVAGDGTSPYLGYDLFG